MNKKINPLAGFIMMILLFLIVTQCGTGGTNAPANQRVPQGILKGNATQGATIIINGTQFAPTYTPIGTLSVGSRWLVIQVLKDELPVITYFEELGVQNPRIITGDCIDRPLKFPAINDIYSLGLDDQGKQAFIPPPNEGKQRFRPAFEVAVSGGLPVLAVTPTAFTTLEPNATVFSNPEGLNPLKTQSKKPLTFLQIVVSIGILLGIAILFYLGFRFLWKHV